MNIKGSTWTKGRRADNRQRQSAVATSFQEIEIAPLIILPLLLSEHYVLVCRLRGTEYREKEIMKPQSSGVRSADWGY